MAQLKQSMASVAALLFSVAILLAGNGLLSTLLPVRARLETFSDASIGILGSSYFIGFTLGCLAGPMLIARAGHIRTYLALVSVASAAALLHVLIVEPALWWCLRAVTGFCFAVLFLVIESWLNERSDNESRGAVFSIYTIINLTVVTIGQLMLTLGDPKAFPLFAVVSILVSLAGVPVAMTRSQSPEPVPFMRPRLARLYAASPVGFLGSLAVGLANSAFWTFGPVFALEAGLGAAGIGLFMSITVFGGAAGQWPLGRLSDRIDRRIAILATCVLAALAGFALAHFHRHAPGLIFTLGFGFGLFAFPLYALSVAHANDFAGPGEHVEISSGLLLVFGAGSVAGPLLASLADGIGGYQALFVYTATVHLLIAGFALCRMAFRAPIPSGDKGDFRDALVATQTVGPLEIPRPADAAKTKASG